MRLLDIKEVCERTSLCRSTIYKKMEKATFPAPKTVSQNRVAWREDEICAWIAAL